jgi:DNA-binding transcriptional LysR family regulator
MFDQLFSRRGISLERLKTLCEIAAAEGIAKAAGRDQSRQSQYSRQLKDLETHFGTALFNRQTKTLTEAGSRVLEACKPFLTSLEKLSADFSAANQTVSIGAGQAALDWVLFPRFAALSTAFPRIVWSIRDFNSKDIATRLLDYSLDFGILRKEACQNKDMLECRELGVMKFALFVPSALRHGTTIPVAAMASSEQFTPAFAKIAEKFTPPLVVKLRCQSFPAIKTIVRTGQCAGMLPLLAADGFAKPEFEIVKTPEFSTLARNYVLAANRKNVSMRDLDKVHNKLAEVCRMQFQD